MAGGLGARIRRVTSHDVREQPGREEPVLADLERQVDGPHPAGDLLLESARAGAEEIDVPLGGRDERPLPARVPGERQDRRDRPARALAEEVDGAALVGGA
jgi:hypothetical protein